MRYQQIADELREAIRKGVYEPGSRLPSHPDLAKQYGVSRTLAKQAIDILVAEGLVRAEQGRGVVVLAAPVTKRVRTIDRDYRSDTRRSSFADELRKAGLEPRTKLVRQTAIKPPARIAEHLGIRAAEEVVVRERRMWASDTPVQIATSYIPMRYAGSPETCTNVLAAKQWRLTYRWRQETAEISPATP